MRKRNLPDFVASGEIAGEWGDVWSSDERDVEALDGAPMTSVGRPTIHHPPNVNFCLFVMPSALVSRMGKRKYVRIFPAPPIP